MTDADLNLLLALLVIGVGIVCAIAIWIARRSERQLRATGFGWKRLANEPSEHFPDGGPA